MDIRPVFHVHPSEDVWEEYAFGRLSAEVLEKAEEHLLVCAHCQDVLANVDEEIRYVKHGLTQFSAKRDRQRRTAKILSFPIGKRAAGAWAAIAACFALVAWQHGLPETPAATVGVQLESFRGVSRGVAEERTANQAPAKHPLDLQIATSTVPPAASYRIEVVTSTGGAVWSGDASIANGSLSAHMPKQLKAGIYWVRLYGGAAGLLAEYGLRVVSP